MTISAWFSIEPTPDDRVTAFLRTLAAAAERWTFTDVGPGATSTDLGSDGRVMVEIKVPGLTSHIQHLLVSYRPDVEGRPALQSAWSAYPLFDEYDDTGGAPDEETQLWVSGVDAGPEQCATWAAAWFERQLSRRIIRREWDRPTSGVSLLIPTPDSTGPVAVEWLIESPDQRFESRGGFTWWWLMRRPPTRTVVERAGAEPQG